MSRCAWSSFRMRPLACINLSLLMSGPMVSTASAFGESRMSAPRHRLSSKKTKHSCSRIGELLRGHDWPIRLRTNHVSCSWLKKTAPLTLELVVRASIWHSLSATV
eukprot:scaffold106501_cov30-Tisochrysis_lutea.AAC.6